MAANTLNLRVLTPVRAVLEKPVDFVVLSCVNGDKGVLPGHERYVARLQTGMLRIFEGWELVDSIFVMGGTAIVAENSITVLTEMAGGLDEVKTALHKIEEQLEHRRQDELRSDVEIHRAEVALRNALVHLDVSSYSVLSAKRDIHGR